MRVLGGPSDLYPDSKTVVWLSRLRILHFESLTGHQASHMINAYLKS